MKKIKRNTLPLLPVLLVVILFCTLQSSSCSKVDDIATTPVSVTTTGKWHVSLYLDGTKDETYRFSGYSFTFNSNGTVLATEGTASVTGTWNDNGSRFIIDFGNDPILKKASDDWMIASKSSVSISLKDDNVASNERLELQKD